MCNACNDTGWVNGRVDHVRYTDRPSRHSSASNPIRHECYAEGDIACPYCRADTYGKITAIVVRSDHLTGKQICGTQPSQ